MLLILKTVRMGGLLSFDLKNIGRRIKNLIYNALDYQLYQ